MTASINLPADAVQQTFILFGYNSMPRKGAATNKTNQHQLCRKSISCAGVFSVLYHRDKELNSRQTEPVPAPGRSNVPAAVGPADFNVLALFNVLVLLLTHSPED